MVWREVITGLEITESGVAAACVEASRGRLLVTRGGFEPWAEGEGEGDARPAIRRLWRRARIPSRLVCTSLNSGAVLLHYFRYEGLTEEQVRSAVRLEAEETLQIPSKDLVLDCHLVGLNGTGRSGGVCEGILAAAPRSAVDDYCRRLQMAGVVPVILDAAPLALANLWLWLKREPAVEPVVFLVGLTRRQAHLVQVTREGRAFARTVVFESAETAAIGSYLSENMASQQEYAETKAGIPPAHRVLITGEGSDDEELRALLARRLEVTVEEWIPLTDPAVRCAGPARSLLANADAARRMTVCLGLALRGLDDADR